MHDLTRSKSLGFFFGTSAPCRVSFVFVLRFVSLFLHKFRLEMVKKQGERTVIRQLDIRFKTISTKHPFAFAIKLVYMAPNLADWKPRQQADVDVAWVVSVHKKRLGVVRSEIPLVEDAD